MSILSLFFALIILGVAVWAINAYLPIDPSFKKLITIVAVVMAIFIVLNAFGVFHGLGNMKVPTINK